MTPMDDGSLNLPQGGHDELSWGTHNNKKTLLLWYHISVECKLPGDNAEESAIPSEEGTMTSLVDQTRSDTAVNFCDNKMN